MKMALITSPEIQARIAAGASVRQAIKETEARRKMETAIEKVVASVRQLREQIAADRAGIAAHDAATDAESTYKRAKLRERIADCEAQIAILDRQCVALAADDAWRELQEQVKDATRDGAVRITYLLMVLHSAGRIGQGTSAIRAKVRRCLLDPGTAVRGEKISDVLLWYHAPKEVAA
jgi:hypothetical protein